MKMAESDGVAPFAYRSSLLAAPHGFFTRIGGVSSAPYESLNGGLNTEDNPENIAENRAVMAHILGVDGAHFLGVTQVHGAEVLTIIDKDADLPLSSTEADGLVTNRADVALTIATADCAPVLFSNQDGTIVGAAHAGWRGAASGVLEKTISAMQRLGAKEITAVVGPSIGLTSYEVASDMRDQVLQMVQEGEDFFHPQETGRYLFDLPGFCLWRLRRAGLDAAEALSLDTMREAQFFSYRRSTLAQSGPTGRQISAIRARSGTES